MKNKLQLLICFGSMAAICLFFVSTPAQGIGDRNRPAGTGTYRITGRVLSPTGAPANGVSVGLSSMEMSSGGGSTKTDEDGNFEFSGLSSGNYTVSARAEGFPTETESLTIAEGAAMSGQGFSVVLYLRMPGQKKGDIYSMNPLFKDVPKGAMDKFKKGVEKMQVNDAKAAITFFEAAIQEYPNFAAAYYDAGMAYLRENDLDKALASFVKAIELKSDYTDAKYYVGYTQYQKKNYEVAAAVFDDVLKQKDTPESHLYLGMALTNLRNIDAAIPHLKAAIAKKDTESMALAHRYLGFIYTQKKQNAEAAAELQRYLDLVPKAPDADKLRTTIANLKKSA
jgi:TolA-binding protein